MVFSSLIPRCNSSKSSSTMVLSNGLVGGRLLPLLREPLEDLAILRRLKARYQLQVCNLQPAHSTIQTIRALSGRLFLVNNLLHISLISYEHMYVCACIITSVRMYVRMQTWMQDTHIQWTNPFLTFSCCTIIFSCCILASLSSTAWVRRSCKESHFACMERGSSVQHTL